MKDSSVYVSVRLTGKTTKTEPIPPTLLSHLYEEAREVEIRRKATPSRPNQFTLLRYRCKEQHGEQNFASLAVSSAAEIEHRTKEVVPIQLCHVATACLFPLVTVRDLRT